jgi:hypothetical protein
LTPLDAEVRAVCRQAFEDWVAALAPRLPLRDERSRRSCAVMVVAAIEGAFVLARAAGDGQPFRDVGRWVSALPALQQTNRGSRTRPRASRRT